MYTTGQNPKIILTFNMFSMGGWDIDQTVKQILKDDWKQTYSIW